jgi:hypothetical protein
MVSDQMAALLEARPALSETSVVPTEQAAAPASREAGPAARPASREAPIARGAGPALPEVRPALPEAAVVPRKQAAEPASREAGPAAPPVSRGEPVAPAQVAASAWREASVVRVAWAVSPALWEAPIAAGRSQAVALARGPSATRVAPAEPAVGLEMGDRRRAVPECSGLPRGVCAPDDHLSGVPLAAALARSSHRIGVPPHCKVTPAGRAPE